MGLTKSDKDDLNKAILEYLSANGYSISFETFMKEADIEPSDDSKSLK